MALKNLPSSRKECEEINKIISFIVALPGNRFTYSDIAGKVGDANKTQGYLFTLSENGDIKEKDGWLYKSLFHNYVKEYDEADELRSIPKSTLEIAKEANEISKKANGLSKEANLISNKSNEISEQALAKSKEANKISGRSFWVSIVAIIISIIATIINLLDD